MFAGLESPIHLLIVLIVVLLFFGGKRVPELAKGLGKGVREFRQGLEEGAKSHDDEKPEQKRATEESSTGQGHSGT
jgi:sec-independent protein translocase protein TatA